MCKQVCGLHRYLTSYVLLHATFFLLYRCHMIKWMETIKVVAMCITIMLKSLVRMSNVMYPDVFIYWDASQSSGTAEIHRLFKAHATCTILSNVVTLVLRSMTVKALSTGPVSTEYLFLTICITRSTCL